MKMKTLSKNSVNCGSELCDQSFQGMDTQMLAYFYFIMMYTNKMKVYLKMYMLMLHLDPFSVI